MTTTAESAPVRFAAGPLAAATATPARALVLMGLVGAGGALQAWLNGRLSGELGSVEVASLVNSVVGWLSLMALALASGSLRRAVARFRAGARPRPWMFAGGVFGALLIAASTAAAPKVGVALLTVAVVCGQTGGGLPVDASGLNPAGRQHVTAPRVLGALLAVVAVVVSSLGSGGELHLWLLALCVVAGLGIAVQQAINGRLAEVTGEPGAAALANFTVSGAILAALVLVVTLGDHVSWGGSPLLWTGGLLGAFYVLAGAAAVRTLGVLRLTLVAVAGQAAGALVIDLIAPAPDEAVGVATVTGVLLTLVAVFVSGRARESTA